MLKFIKQYADSIEGVQIYPIISLLIFVLFFIAVLYFVKRMSRQHVNELRSMPLDGGEVETPIAHPFNQF